MKYPSEVIHENLERVKVDYIPPENMYTGHHKMIITTDKRVSEDIQRQISDSVSYYIGATQIVYKINPDIEKVLEEENV
jgi:hypothetical protein